MVRMIYTGIREGAGMVAIKIAALLSVSKSFFNYAGRDADAETKTKFDEKRKPFQHKDGDILTIFKLYTQYESLTGDDDKLNGKEKKKIRAEWLKKNSLNGKAFGTAEKTVEDLEYVFSRTRLWNGAQDLMPDDNGILRLFCSGYFLHAACRVNIKGRGRNRLNYFALEPEVSGFLPVKASFVQTTNGISDGTIPNWILFDQILKYPDSGTTFFPSSSRIELDWIQKESEIFYKRCLDKQELLPTEVVELKVSDTVLRAIFGKRLVNLPRLEEELSCSLDADLFAGSLRGFCSKFFRPTVELKLKEEINRAMGVIEKETLEQTWLLNTRLVIGPGYEVTSVLFSGEYNTFYLRNLDRNCSREGFEQFIYSKISSDKVSSLQFVPQERSNTGVVKLLKPCDAVSLLNKLKDELNAIQSDVIVAPHLGDGSSGTIPRAEQLKLKISWPVGFSTGNATITVETYQEGNRIVDLLPLHFSGATATAIGKLTPEPTSKDPEVYRVERGKMKFLESATYQVQPVLKVRVKGLSLSVDEFEITDYLKKKLSITPLRVFMNRNAVKECQWNMLPEEKEKNLEPFRDSSIGKDKDVTITDIFDKFGGRAGVLIHYSDAVALENAFSQLQKAYSEILSSYGQPFRVELERLFTFSVHTDLYQCFKSKFKKALEEIKKWGCWVNISGPGTDEQNKNQHVEKKSKFVGIKFRHTDEKTIRNCRRKLESVLEKDVLDLQSSPNIANLFTYTGRLMMQDQIPNSTDYYIHWDNQKFQICIYGKNDHVKNVVKGQLERIMTLIEKWKKAGCFEVVVMLDRKALERYQKTNKNYIDTICKGFNFVKGQYRLIGTNKLIFSTSSNETRERFESLLESRGLKWEPKKKPAVARDCGVCFCEVDKEFMVTSICNHAFCMGCIRTMFASAAGGAGIQDMPLRCPTDQCGRLLPIQDIMKAAPAQAIPKLNEASLDAYLKTANGSKIKHCPKPGCNQIFSPNNLYKTGIEDPTFYYCDNCLTDFCLDCTALLAKEVPAHPGIHCKDVQISEDDKLYKIVNYIRDEILNLRCPRCTAPFYDFEGCAALICGTCQIGFCALCLKDCDSDAHSHVMKCEYNTVNNMYVPKDVIEEANRRLRIDKLSKYLLQSSELKVLDVKRKVFYALSKDLADLNIKLTDIQCS